MKKKDEKKTPEEKDEFSTELKGTFFDTFQFTPEEEGTVKPKTSVKKEEDEEETPEEKQAKLDAEAAKKEEEGKKKPEEEEEEEEDTTQKDIEATAAALKEKKAEELEDDEKQFLTDYEAGTLKDYKKEPEEEEKGEKAGYDVLAKTLIEEGILEDSEELEDTQESFSSVITKTVDKKVDDYLAEIPDEYKNIIDFMRTGGDATQYLQSKARIDYEGLDTTKPEVQDALIREDLRQQGYEQTDIDEKIQDFRDLEKSEKEAIRASKLFSKQQDARVTAYDKSIADALKAQEEADDKEIADLSAEIDKLDEIAGFKITKARRKAFKKYLFETDAEGETAASKASKKTDNRINLYFMDFVGYNFDDMERAVTTKKSKDFSKILSRYKDTTTKTKGVPVQEKDLNPEEQGLNIPSMFNRAPEDD